MEKVPESEYSSIIQKIAKEEEYFQLPIIYTLLQHRPRDEVYRVCKPEGGEALFIQSKIRNQGYFVTYGGPGAKEAGEELLKAIPTTRERMFSSMTPRDQELVKKNYGVPVVEDDQCFCWHYPVDEIGYDASVAKFKEAIRDTDRFSLRRLDEEDAKIIDLNWPHRGPFGAYSYIRALVMADTPATSSGFGGFGVVDKKNNNKLIAWGLQYESGALGFIHVMPEYRRCGVGVMLLSALTLASLEQSKGKECFVEPFVYTVAENSAGNGLFKHEGWVNDGNVRWLLTPNAYKDEDEN